MCSAWSTRWAGFWQRELTRMAKRAFDLLFATFALVALLPLLASIAVMIKLDSPGPVLFRQTRVGRHGRAFRIVKFRSMRADAPSTGPALTVGADPRITRAGAWLRTRHFDELPQLANVIAGSMSLVGPRPELAHYAAQVSEPLRSRWLALAPGITDPASLAFADEPQRLAQARDPEATYVREILPAKVQASVAYAERATFASDACVLLRSIALLVRRR
jgi:lipopolysaccharide/colanic/teichoic acid biosynthesis glycosyltransferase